MGRIIYGIILLTIFTFAFSQYIITSNDYFKVLAYNFQKVQTALNEGLTNKLSSLTYPQIKSEVVEASNFKPTGSAVSLDNSYGNQVNGLYLFSPGKVHINFSFDYKSKTQTELKNAELELSIFDLRSTFGFDEAAKAPVISSVIELRQKDFSIFDASSKDDTNELSKAIYKEFNKDEFLKQISTSVSQIITEYFKKYYEEIPPFVFVPNSYFNAEKTNVNLNTFMGFSLDVNQVYESGLNFYSGDANGEIETNKLEDALANPDFSKPGNKYNVFINYKVINDLFAKLKSKEPGIVMNFNKKSAPKGLSYDFTVASLKKVFSGIPGDYQDGDEFEIDSTISEITVGKKAETNVTLSNSVKIKDTKGAIEFTAKLSFIAHGKKVRSAVFDVCLGNVTLGETEVKTTGISVSDQATFSKWIVDTLTVGVDKFCLTDKGINLRDYYKLIEKVELGENGIYLQGKHIYEY